MASKREWKHQEQRDKERAYLESFLARLSKADTVGAAANVARHDMPPVSAIGRLRHTSLMHLLDGIEATGGKPPFRVLRDYPLAPAAASRSERIAYAELFDRLARSGDISTEDAEYASRILSSSNSMFDEFI